MRVIPNSFPNPINCFRCLMSNIDQLHSLTIDDEEQDFPSFYFDMSISSGQEKVPRQSFLPRFDAAVRFSLKMVVLVHSRASQECYELRDTLHFSHQIYIIA